jgi:hypothetical protein
MRCSRAQRFSANTGRVIARTTPSSPFPGDEGVNTQACFIVMPKPPLGLSQHPAGWMVRMRSNACWLATWLQRLLWLVKV